MQRRVRRVGRAITIAGSLVGVVGGAAVETLRGRHLAARPAPPEPAPMEVPVPPEQTVLGAFGQQPAAEWVEGVEIHLPAPSVWPAVLGLGITLLAFGIVTSVVFTALGVFLIVWSLQGWIVELRHD